MGSPNYYKKFLVFGIIIIFLFFLGLPVWFIRFLTKSYNSIVVSPISQTIGFDKLTEPTPTPDPQSPYTILLLGYGGFNHDGGYLTDSMIAARIDPKDKKIVLISIPRDLWVALPFQNNTSQNFKINHAYAIGIDSKNYKNKLPQFSGEAGAGALAKMAVNEALGIPIDYFVSLDFNGFIKAIDTLGGLDITIEKTFIDPWYPLEDKKADSCGRSEEELKQVSATMSGEKLEQMFTCRYETLNFVKGQTHMDGITALKYVRSRHSQEDGTDFARSQRQKSVITAVRNKIINLGFIPKLIPFVTSLSSNLKTDISLDRMQKMITISSDISDYKIKSLSLTTDNVLMEARSLDRQYILVSKDGENKWETIHDFVRKELESTDSADLR